MHISSPDGGRCFATDAPRVAGLLSTLRVRTAVIRRGACILDALKHRGAADTTYFSKLAGNFSRSRPRSMTGRGRRAPKGNNNPHSRNMMKLTTNRRLLALAATCAAFASCATNEHERDVAHNREHQRDIAYTRPPEPDPAATHRAYPGVGRAEDTPGPTMPVMVTRPEPIAAPPPGEYRVVNEYDR